MTAAAAIVTVGCVSPKTVSQAFGENIRIYASIRYSRSNSQFAAHLVTITSHCKHIAISFAKYFWWIFPLLFPFRRRECVRLRSRVTKVLCEEFKMKRIFCICRIDRTVYAGADGSPVDDNTFQWSELIRPVQLCWPHFPFLLVTISTCGFEHHFCVHFSMDGFCRFRVDVAPLLTPTQTKCSRIHKNATGYTIR